jgi:hypothetical protein
METYDLPGPDEHARFERVARVVGETCGDCGVRVHEAHDRWEDPDGQAWCKGPDGARPIWEQGHFPVRSQKPEGKVCRCIAAKVEHIHHLKILPDGAALGPN